MGGSATSCDILATLMQTKGSIPSAVIRGTTFPSYIGKKSLVVINSASGNTIETLKNMHEAIARGSEVICISSGGKLKELADQAGQRHIAIPNFSLPRASLPYLLMPGLAIIDQFLHQSIVEETDDLYQHLTKIKKRISLKAPETENEAKNIASFFKDGFAFCFSSPQLLPASTRFKNSLNENSKVPCLKESVLEASHNEVVPFTYEQVGFLPKVMLFSWSEDEQVVKNRFKRIESFFLKINQPLIRFSANEKSLVKALISSIYILDYSTIYIAIARKIDPSPTPAIDVLKSIDF
jgi:glucose/mannose-6-phosphate isomerase